MMCQRRLVSYNQGIPLLGELMVGNLCLREGGSICTVYVPSLHFAVNLKFSKNSLNVEKFKKEKKKPWVFS